MSHAENRWRMTPWWPQQLLLGWLNVTLTAPIIYLYIGLPLVMRQHGWSGTEIGLLQLAGLPAMLKFLLATPLDRYPLGRDSYRNWAMMLGLGYIAALLLMGAHDLQSTSHGMLFALAVLVNLMGTWADVPVNALAIRILPASERFRAGAIRSAATSLGAIVGGGLMLMLHARYGWVWPFRVLSFCLLSGLFLLLVGWRLPTLALRQTPAASVNPMSATERAEAAVVVQAEQAAHPAEAQGAQVGQVGWRSWWAYFQVPAHRMWSLLVLLYFPFVGAAWVYLKPLLLDHGFAPERIALIVGVVGGLVGAFGSVMSGWLTRKLGANRTLPLFAVLSLLAVAWLGMVTVLGLGQHAFVSAVLAIAMAMGMSSGLVFGLMMYHTRPGLQALDYGIQSSLFIIARTTVPVAAGVLLDHFGYAGMLTGLSAGLVLALCLAWQARGRVLTRA